MHEQGVEPMRSALIRGGPATGCLRALVRANGIEPFFTAYKTGYFAQKKRAWCSPSDLNRD